MKRQKSNGNGKPETQHASGPDEPLTRAGKVRLRSLDNLDQRTHAAQRAHALVADLERDLGGDLTTAQRELVKRAALLGAIVEDHEVRWLKREGADLSIYGTLVDRQRRILETLGLRRVPHDITARAIELARSAP